MEIVKSSKKIVTILVPTFNRPQYLTKTLETLIAYQDIARILVINDGGELLSDIQPYVEVLNLNSNIGEASAINLGWKLTKTDFFTVVSDDDPQDGNWLYPLIQEAKTKPNVIAFYPSTKVVYANGRTIEFKAKKYNREIFLNLLRCPCLAGVLINRKVLSELGVDKLRVNNMIYPNDLIQWLELSKFGEFVPVNESLATWTRHDSQMSEVLSKTYQSKEFYRNVSNWQSENLTQASLPDAVAITLLRSMQILLTSKDKNWLVNLKGLFELLNIHSSFLSTYEIKRSDFVKRFFIKIMTLIKFKVSNV